MSIWIPVIISSLALAVSAVTAWLTLFRRGALKMTQPTVIFFGPDGGPREGRVVMKFENGKWIVQDETWRSK